MKSTSEYLIIFLICLCLLFTVSGCTSTVKPPQPAAVPADNNSDSAKDNDQSAKNTDPSSSGNKNDSGDPIKKDVVQGKILIGNYPDPIQKYLDTNKQKESQQAFNINNKTYIVITMGEQRSGGYSIMLKAMTLKDGKLVINASYIKPGKDDNVSMAITYPHLVIETDKIYEGHYEIDYQIQK